MLANPLFINNEVKLDCEFSIYKSRSFISPSVNPLFVNNLHIAGYVENYGESCQRSITTVPTEV